MLISKAENRKLALISLAILMGIAVFGLFDNAQATNYDRIIACNCGDTVILDYKE